MDLLVLGPSGFFVVEVKSRPGSISGDAGGWVWRFEKKVHHVDNPVFLTNLKAKRLKTLLQNGKDVDPRDVPWVEPVVFCSAPSLDVKLPPEARARVFGREPEEGRPGSGLPGVVAELTRVPSGLSGAPRRRAVDTALARALTRAVENAGIRERPSTRRVGDYELEELVLEGALFQDFSARHRSLPGVRRRVRIYAAPAGSAVARETVLKAARREFELLQSADHPGVLRVHEYVESDLGPALLFEPAEGSLRFDRYLRERGDALTVDQRLHVLRTVGETLRYAHGKGILHRALSPWSLLVLDPAAEAPRVKVFNWQTGVREAASSTSRGVTGTEHLDQLVEDAAAVYMAPEALSARDADGVDLDVFSLGALAFRLFSGKPPAESPLQMSEVLRPGQGLVLSAGTDGVPLSLQKLVREATDPDTTRRLASAAEFLSGLDAVEDELTRPSDGAVSDPEAAVPGSLLPGGFTVKRRLGTGSTAMAFLVERDGREMVLKLALSPDLSRRLDEEAEVLDKLRHPGIVPYRGKAELFGRTGILLGFAGDETLRDRLRRDGALLLDQLPRWGEDLLRALVYLEETGIPHRDVKPENLGITIGGSDEALHLVLFDFSLSRAPLESIRAGTRPYLDPFLPLRKPQRWDLAAERWAVATTLHEMATGGHPRWGDGRSDPASLKVEATIDVEAFDPAVREPLAAFFTRAFRRDPKKRFDNASEMLAAWRAAFAAAERPTTAVTHPVDAEAAWAAARAETPLSELPLSARSVGLLERARILTVRDLLGTSEWWLRRVRGAGRTSRVELLEARERLVALLPELSRGGEKKPPPTGTETEPEVPLAESVDELFEQVAHRRFGKGATTEPKVFAFYLGLEPVPGVPPGLLPTQKEIARHLRVTQPQVSVTAGKFREVWAKNRNVTRLRREVAEVLDAHSGAATVAEVEAAVLASRGSSALEPERSVRVRAVVRAALETERGLKVPAWTQHRVGGALLLVRDERLADWAARLGKEADALAALDPLASPVRAQEALQAVPFPKDLLLPPPVRLVRLAAAVSRNAASSSRLEVYPRGLAAGRALRLAAGAVVGAKRIPVEDLRARVLSRYPESQPLPDRPALDALIEEAKLDLRWKADPAGGGAYEAPEPTYGLTSLPKTAPTTVPVHVPTRDDPAAEFDRRLAQAAREGGYLVLLAPERELTRAREAIAARAGIEIRSLDRLFLDALKATAESKKVKWDAVLRADAAPADGPEGTKLRTLVGNALPRLEEALAASGDRLLLTEPGLLVRYRRLDVLDRLRDRVTSPGGKGAAWVLVPADEQTDRPVLDGVAIPVLTPNQWARVPLAWIEAQATAGTRHEEVS